MHIRAIMIPDEIYDELKKIAFKRDIGVFELIRKFIKFGFLAVSIEDDPNTALILREGDREREIVFFEETK